MDETDSVVALPWFQRPLVSLGHPPFRLFWMSNLVFAVGLMVQFTARGWLHRAAHGLSARPRPGGRSLWRHVRAGLDSSLSQSVLLTAGVLFVAGAGQSALFASYDTLLLIRLPDEMRGRVMGLMFTLVALFPIGAAVAGAVADQVGLRAVAIAEGVIIISMAAVAWRVVLSRTAA